MKFRNQLLTATGCGLLALAACQSPKKQIIGKWQMDSFESPAMDSFAQVKKKSIDTITHVDSAMMVVLGTHNLDSIKAILKRHADDYKQQAKDAAAVSSISFLKSGMVIFHTGLQEDTNKWEITGKDKLILSPYNEAQRSAGLKPDTALIQSIGKGKLRLRLRQNKNFVYVNLHTFTKADSLKANEIIQKQQQMMQQQMQQVQQMQQQEEAEAKAKQGAGKAKSK